MIEEFIAHYGTKRHSGRYPWGSGGDGRPATEFLKGLQELKKKGLSDTEIAGALGINTTELRQFRTLAKAEKKQADISMASRLRDKGLSNGAIAERMGLAGESSVRALLAQSTQDKVDVLTATKDMLRDQVATKNYIDVGAGTEQFLRTGVSSTKMATAVKALREEGYPLYYVKYPQGGTGQFTTVKVLAKPGTPYSEVFANRDKVQQIQSFTEDGGRSFFGILPPLSISSSRVAVRYGDDGGADADGVIYVRPGVRDIALGGSRYSQVRIAVDGSHYLKGVAMYKDDLPDGVDLVFNTNKKNTGNKLDAMKALVKDPSTGKIDQDNPFGAVLQRQIHPIGPDGKPDKDRVESVMNIVNEEGSWGKWSKSLSSQMLSKQSPVLAKQQLDMTFERRKAELDAIKSLTNPTVRKKLLDAYSDDVDAAAVHLKAAHLPRQASHVILPVSSLKENEVHAPNYRNGETVALIRYPHGGTFEIPLLKVNNNNREAKSLLGNAPDAIGIHPNVAKRLSGADFDGDTVLVIPNNSGNVKSTPGLRGLKDFDPQAAYPGYEGMPKLTPDRKQQLMGDVSNLITDMTIKGATDSEKAQAVRHSMVVIDAEKHNLNYKLSAEVNGIAALKRKYQSKPGESGLGASTIVSRKKSTERVLERIPRRAKDGGPVDEKTGKKVFEETGRSYVDENGKVVFNTTKVKKLELTDDAHTLSSGMPIERIYADHSNRLKDLANQARLESVHTPPIRVDATAKKAYAKEAASLSAKLEEAERNRPLERQARILADGVVREKRRAYPDMEGSDLKKIEAQALAEARTRTGARKKLVDITDEEWAAIQAGAITNYKLVRILNNTDLDQVKKLATPRSALLMSSAKSIRAQSMLAAGYTQAEVADHLGVSLSTLKASLKGDG